MLVGAGLLLAELVVLFFAVSFAIELLQRRVGPDRLRAWMGGRPVVAAFKGILIGFVTPFCTYSAIPMLVGMRQAAVPPAGYVAFIVAAPVLDPILFGALVIIIGAQVAVLYLVVVFVAAMALALVAPGTGIERHLKPLPAFTPATRVAVPTPGPHPTDPDRPTAGLGDAAACENQALRPWRGARIEIRHAGLAAVKLLRSVGLLLLIGVAIGLAIEELVPAETVAAITGGGPMLSIPTAATLGIPLYFHTELFVPIADSLSSAGVGVGTTVALTIAGAGANVPELVILSRLVHWRLVAALFAYVFMIAVAGGFLAQAIGA
jgi:uncharacterized membrane protein YraQ (UPF0718 family)